MGKETMKERPIEFDERFKGCLRIGNICTLRNCFSKTSKLIKWKGYLTQNKKNGKDSF